MVCYARPASLLAAIVAVAWLVFAGPVSHFFSTAAVMVAVLVATAGAAATAVVAFAAFMSTRRRRAGAGGCVSCRFQCQHAMTGQRLWLVTTADRRQPAGPGQAVTGRQAPGPVRSAPVFLPMPEIPQWPDRPLHRVPGQARAGSAACSVSS